jgi:predicted nucleic acid-binding protein
MVRYLLDTNHLSPLVTVGHRLRDRVLSSLGSGNEFAIPVPVLAEFLFGVRMTTRAIVNLKEWERLHDSFGYYRIGRSEAEGAAELQVTLRHTGWQLATVDALIATVALRNKLTLLTADGDFSSIAQLQQENWLAE